MPTAGWLSFAAAPAFGVMALATIGAPNMLCSVDASPLSGMAPMYLLMTTFHAGPWLKLIADWRSARA